MPCAIRPSCCSPPAACSSFFLLFVLPQFAAVLQDFNAKLDPIVAALFDLSEFARAHLEVIEIIIVILIVCGWLVFRRAAVRARIAGVVDAIAVVEIGGAVAIAPPYFAGISGFCSAAEFRSQ